MKTDAQRARDARKRRKLRDHSRGVAPHTWRLSITTYIWDGWHNDCQGVDVGEGKASDWCFFNPCWNDQIVHAFWGYKSCSENMAQNHFRVVHSGWIVNSGHEVGSHQLDYLEAHGASVNHHKAFLLRDLSDCVLRFGWNAQEQRRFEIRASKAEGCFLRTELLVERNDGQIGGHVWQGIGILGIGAADVAAVASTLAQSPSPQTSQSLTLG